ncbi:unnamed protein product [Lactuca saligna]|uniref:Replication protein A 70 kDa DNA-binding subunit B/D first OB fold domain-containing protein n=1 Tax=Lactuca saligna TaxID=75948 RepID=A0AA35ZTG1_LACSI|nr:unnamed protein product [Lactuca saligna]
MTDKKITLIKDLDNMNDDYTLEMFIIRLWRSISDVNPTIVKSIEMILMNEMCTKIRASVYPRDFQRFESKLKEDQAVYIRSPTIAPNRYTFKISDVNDKLNLHGRTIVNECLHFQSKIAYGFSFVSFERIISATTTSNESIGLLSVNSHFDHTRMLIDVDLPDIVTFTDNLVGLRGLQNPSSSLTVDTSQSYSEYDEFLEKHNVKKVVDLLEPEEVGKFIIVGTIYGIR